jgi:hypothetical protein
MQPSNTQEPSSQPTEDEISLFDIFNFLMDNWKFYVAGSLLGLLIALGFVSIKGQYDAELVLINQESGLDFMTWRVVQKNLLTLANEQAASSDQSTSLQKAMITGEWWKKAVVPTYSLTKAETKELVGISKEIQDLESTRIQSFVVRVSGKSLSDAQQNVGFVVNFIRTGAIFSAASAVVINLQSKVALSASRIQLDISRALREMSIMTERRDRFYALRKEFPNENVVSQVVDVNEDVAKFLPIATQLVAVLTDINLLDEKLLRFQQEKSQLEIASEFVTRANAVLKSGLQNQSLIADLLNLEGEMRKNIPSNDLSKIIVLDEIKNSLVIIQTSYTLGLQQLSPPAVVAPKYVKPAGIGLFAGAFFGLLCSVFLVFSRTAMNRRRDVSHQMAGR